MSYKAKHPSTAQRAINWLWSLIPRNHACHQRRLTPSYQRKKAMVKNLWLGSGLIMLANPIPGLIVVGALLTTFLAFMILDEMG